jgi:hypothetical protein
VALVIGVFGLIILSARKHIDDDRPSTEPVFHDENAAHPGTAIDNDLKKSHAIGVSQKAGIAKKGPGITPESTRPLTLAAELKSADDKDVSELAEISRRALLCQARRVVLKRGDAFEQDIAAAKTADVRAFLQKEYEAFLPQIKKAEADTDEQCDSLSDSDLDIVARESTLRAAALGDSDAQMCSMYALPEIFAVSDDAQQASIGQQAANYLAAGLDRGDWRAVRLLQMACSPRAGVRRLNLVCEGLPVLRMQVILALGAPPGERRNELMRDIARITAEVDSTGSLQLQGKSYPKQEVDSAIDWAKEEYAKHFQNSSYDYNQPTCVSQGYGILR